MKFGSHICNPFPTLGCDFACPYCITKATPGYDFGYQHRSSEDWAAALNGLEDVKQIVINGGEPTLRPEFATMVNLIAPSNESWPDGWKIAIGCNGTARARAELQKIRPRRDLIIDFSFHPTEINLPEIASTALALKHDGHNVRVHTVGWPGLGKSAEWFAAQLRELQIEAFVQTFDGRYNGEPRGVLVQYPDQAAAHDPAQSPRKARCTRTVFTPIAPNGDVHWCHFGMYSQAKWSVIGNIFDGWMSDQQLMECESYGLCNPCDRPRKTEVL